MLFETKTRYCASTLPIKDMQETSEVTLSREERTQQHLLNRDRQTGLRWRKIEQRLQFDDRNIPQILDNSIRCWPVIPYWAEIYKTKTEFAFLNSTLVFSTQVPPLRIWRKHVVIATTWKKLTSNKNQKTRSNSRKAVSTLSSTEELNENWRAFWAKLVLMNFWRTDCPTRNLQNWICKLNPC